MSTAHSAAEFGQTTASTRRAYSFFGSHWDAFQEWRKRQRLRADLSCLNDFELQDIGISRGEIDYVASNRSFDPRDIRSTPPRHA